MDMQRALRARLLGDGAISGAVGARVDWVERPAADGLPAITLQTISDPRPVHMKGRQAFRQTRVQLDVWARDYAAARRIAETAIGAVEPRADFGGVHFDSIFFEGPRDLSERTDAGTVHRATMDLLIWHSMKEEDNGD